ncbi:MAG: LAGLIDADG family homing endonuclease, partial [Candidatus Berkelbacteria bacterium]|nr:LAGLIDADG family homing endonuclease [Candidatus Berkelbacteria bacterium]
MVKLSSTIKSYIAGFLDGDGCIMFQIVPRRDYRLGYEIRASIVFYQKTLYKKHLQWLRQVFEIGYLRDRG